MIKRLGPIEFSRSLMHILRGHPNIPESLEGNALLRTILHRRSVRRFADTPIPDDIFQAILEAARVAPSTVNLQTWSFALFTSDGWQEWFGRPIPFRAQRAVIVLADTHRARAVLDVFPSSPLVEYTIGVMNASLAAMAMNFAAEALGVSSVMLSETGRSGFLDAEYLVEKLALPPGVIPLMTIVFGYPRGALPPMPPRLPLETITFTGAYREAERVVMEAWFDEMIAGYKASRPTSSFEAQLRIYQDKLAQAEGVLQKLLFAADGAP